MSDALAGGLLVTLIPLLAPNGSTINVNPEQIVSVRPARDTGEPNKQMHDSVRCLLEMTDGKFVNVAEECDVVLAKLHKKAKP